MEPGSRGCFGEGCRSLRFHPDQRSCDACGGTLSEILGPRDPEAADVSSGLLGSLSRRVALLAVIGLLGATIVTVVWLALTREATSPGRRTGLNREASESALESGSGGPTPAQSARAEGTERGASPELVVSPDDSLEPMSTLKEFKGLEAEGEGGDEAVIRTDEGGLQGEEREEVERGVIIARPSRRGNMGHGSAENLREEEQAEGDVAPPVTEADSPKTGIPGQAPVDTNEALVVTGRRDVEYEERKEIVDSEDEPGVADVVRRLRFTEIPPYTFDLGCTVGDGACGPSEKPRVRVTIKRRFYMSAIETTNELYQVCETMGACSPPSKNRRYSNSVYGDHPVTDVSWWQAREFCAWIGGRLPTEAEWEWAARGLRIGDPYPLGRELTHEDANFAGVGGGDRWEGTAPVAQFNPNRNGLFDMSGNVREWVRDSRWIYRRSTLVDPVGTEDDRFRMIRGGGWEDDRDALRVSARIWAGPGGRSSSLGFRCILESR